MPKMPNVPKFEKGDQVKVRAESHSPYRGYVGVVDAQASKYLAPPKRASGFWYMVRFEWKGLRPAARFMEEELEAATS
jgi:hypothetical protein